MPAYRALIEAAPFAVLATRGPEGFDCSPRGDGPGFVRVADDKTLLLPDQRGHNRIDSLRNILYDPHIALLFLIPGVGESLRVNGRAAISVDPALLESFAVDGKAPRSVLSMAVDTVFFQCSRAVTRAGLWDPVKQVERKSLPSAGEMLAGSAETGSAARTTTGRCPNGCGQPFIDGPFGLDLGGIAFEKAGLSFFRPIEG